ncbi:MAG: sugar ABC transporter permease [Clostridia bacterium]|nr:sugar ABC transporter permease [Clostridia bacterium]
MPLFFLALPALAYVICFNYLPMFGVVLAFKDYSYRDGILGSDWVGFKYFEYFFKSNDAAVVLRNSLLYHLVIFATKTVVCVIVALLLYRIENKKCLKLYQSTIILPNFISWVLVAYIAFLLLSNTQGIFNQLLTSWGMPAIDWYSEPKYWPFILVIFNLWKVVGMDCIIYYATLCGIDPSLFEAAEMDGASRFKQTIHIALPALVPVVCIMSIMAMGSLMSTDFGLFFQVPKNSGALYSATDVISTYTFRGLKAGNMSQTAAVGLFQSVVGTIMTLVTNGIIRKVSPDNAMF